MTFGFLVGFKNFIRLFWVSWEVFVLHRLGPSESTCRHHAYPPGSTIAPLVIHEKNCRCLDVQAPGFPVALKDWPRSSTKFSLNSWSQSSKSCNRSLCTSLRPSLLFLFSVSVGLCCGFPRRSSLILPLLSGTGFSMYLLTSNAEPCDEDDDEVGVGVVEELVDKPGTTNGTKFDKLQPILLSFLWWDVGFWPLVQWEENPWSSQSFPRERIVGVSSRSITLTNKSNSLTFTVASSLVSTSLLAVITVVGLLDVLMVSNSANLKSRLLTVWILARESTTNSLCPPALLLTQPGVPTLPLASRM